MPCHKQTNKQTNKQTKKVKQNKEGDMQAVVIRIIARNLWINPKAPEKETWRSVEELKPFIPKLEIDLNTDTSPGELRRLAIT